MTTPTAAAAMRSTVPSRAGAVCVGMVGGGQLARMTQQAAIDLGVDLLVLATSKDDPAVQAGAHHLLGDPQDIGDLRALAADCDVMTFDHEGIPPEHLETLQRDAVALAPTAAAKLLAQDKLHARRTLTARGLPVPDFAFARTAHDVERFAATHGWPLIAKAPRGGYDGRGVWTLGDAVAARQLLDDLPGGMLLEPLLAIECELAVLVARSSSGEHVTYPVVETVQHDAMCREILAPAPIAPAVAAQARDLALQIADLIDVVGLLAVEFFLTADGLFINELALRPHNSGHYTIEGCATSQFEQHLRAILGWPLGLPTLLAPSVVCVNVIGPPDGSDPRANVALALCVPGAHVHLYAKAAQAGRKLGHVTVCGQDLVPTREAARLAAALLEGTAS